MHVFNIALLTLFCLAVCLAMVLIGMRSAARHDKLFVCVRDIKQALSPTTEPASFQRNEYLQLTFFPGKVVVAEPVVTDRTMVAFAFGQSNSANTGGERYAASSANVINFSGGKFYRAADPLLGASGTGGSVWVNLANKLIAGGVADRVIINSAGIGGTSISEWRKGGRLHSMLVRRLEEAKRLSPVTDFLWHQGEADNPAGLAHYESGMREIIELTKRYFPKSNFFVAVATRRADAPVSPELQAIQAHLTSIPGVYAGPNTDEIGPDDRYDGTHFSGRGIERHAAGWIQAIRAQRSTS